jgi:CubicO group peptidase (beta-lactamase class C family)
MIRRVLVLSALAVAACTMPPPASSQGDINDPRFISLLAYVKDQMERYDIPGAEVAVVENGVLTSSAGLGFERHGGATQVSPSTLFRVASLSKMVLAATAMKLGEEGSLEVSQPITDYVPLTLAPPFVPSTISVANLLTHSSGIPDFGVDSSCSTGSGELAAWFAANGNQPLWTPPGQVWNYSNQGYAVAGWAVEAASGQAFEDAVAQRVFATAGMSTATYDPNAAAAADHAVGRYGGADLEINAYDCEATRPPAGVIASAVDYAHFAEALLAGGGSMLSPASVAAMETGYIDTDQVPNGGERYGYGIEVRDGWKGLHVLRHNGSDHGYQSSIWMVPDQKFAAIVFYNTDSREPEDAAARAVDIYLGVQNVSGPVDTTPVAAWGPYVGTYLDPINLGPVTVTIDDGKLHASLPTFGVTDLTLTQSGGDTFEAKLDGEDGAATFYPGPKGPAQWLVTRSGVAARVGD